MGRFLSSGMTGQDVRLLQRLLNHHLAPPLKPIDEDGIFGWETRMRVIEFQKRNRDYPVRMPIPNYLPREFHQALAPDGIVGPLTANVLFDVRTIKTLAPASFTPNSTPPSPTPPTPPAKTFRLVQLSLGQQATVPWSISPFVFTANYVLLAKNDGRLDFLLTGGPQISLNDGGINGRWTGGGSLQMGLGGFPKLAGNKLDLFNPFVAVMLQRNFDNRLHPISPWGIGAAIGNQSTWTLLSKPLPGTKDQQDTLSLSFNGALTTVTDLSNGHQSAPGGIFLISVIKTFF